VVLLDEPFGALDALSREEILGVFEAVLASGEVSTLLVTHDLRVAFRLAQRVAVLRAGKIVQIGTPETLRGAPTEAYVSRLLERGGVA
jgi:ABC-type proline/glycine betaine transport system ATPase subunit